MLKIVPHKKLNKQAYKSIKDQKKLVSMGVKRANLACREGIKKESGRIMQEAKHGAWLWVYVSKSGRKLKRGRLHHASKKKEPFAWMSGATYRSIKFKVSAIRMEMGISTVWGAYWESQGRLSIKGGIIDSKRDITRDMGREIRRSICSAKKVGI